MEKYTDKEARRHTQGGYFNVRQQLSSRHPVCNGECQGPAKDNRGVVCHHDGLNPCKRILNQGKHPDSPETS